MAITGKVENEYGAEFDYHKIRSVKIENTETNGITLIMTVESYMDKVSRIAGKTPTVRECIINNADFAMLPFYALLKSKFPDFKNVEDDLNNDFKQHEENHNVVFTQQSSDYSQVKQWNEIDNQENEI